MADILNESMIMEFQDAFNSLADSKGIISTKMLGPLLKLIGENPPEEEIQDIVNDVDKNGTGVFKFPEFLSMMAKKCDLLVADDDIREAFKVFDCDGNGFISRSELKHVLCNLGEAISEDECNYLVEEADIDGDGSINYEEFCAMMNSVGSYNKGAESWD